MRVVFKDRHEKNIPICLTRNIREALNLIDRDAKDRGYEIYYTRIWPSSDDKSIWVDFGSHVEFGVIYMEDGESAMEYFVKLNNEEKKLRESGKENELRDV